MTILDLPPNVMITIFACLDQRDLVNSVRKTCKLWYDLSFERKLWKQVDMNMFPKFHFCTRTFNEMLLRISDSVEVLFMNLKDLDKEGVLHESVICHNLKKLILTWDRSMVVKSGRKDYTLHCIDGSQLRTCLPILSHKYIHLKSLHLLSHVVFIKDLAELFVELEELEIEYCDLTFEDAETTIESFFNVHNSIKYLAIRFSVFDQKTLSYILSNVPGLKSLDLSNSNFNCDEIEMEGIHQVNLERLILTNTRSNDKLLGNLVKNASELLYVSMGDCVDLTNNGLEFLADNCPKLQTLIINEAEYSKCNITDSGLQKVAEHCRNISVLKMIHCEIGDPGLQTISRLCSFLTVLEAAKCTAITDAAVTSVIKHCPLIQIVDLGHCVQLTSGSINILLRTCTHLQFLNLETCHRLSDIKFEFSSSNVDNARHCSVESLSTDEIEITLEKDVEDQPALSKDEMQDSPVLLNQDVEEEEEDEKCTEASVPEKDYEEEISNKVNHVDHIAPWHSHIRTLNLGFCSKIDNKCLKQIAKHCPDLQDFNVQGCAMVTNAGVLAVVQGCKFLRKLNISGGSVFQTSRLTDDCLYHIARHCRCLTKLRIVKNHHITIEGVVQVIKDCAKIGELTCTASRTTGVKPESLRQAAGDITGKTICIKILGNNANIEVSTDIEKNLKNT